MAFISPEDGALTVVNLFGARDWAAQDRLLEVMTDIINGADYPGWISSTLHAGQDNAGTANYIQWRSAADLEARYEGEKFRHETIPLFKELSTRIQLLKTEVIFGQRQPEIDAVEITPDRDDYTVIIVMEAAPSDQKVLVEALAQPDGWLLGVPGYRSHSILRGLDGTFVVNYAQWASKELYDSFHELPEEERPQAVRQARSQARSVLTGRSANSYRVVHTRAAE